MAEISIKPGRWFVTLVVLAVIIGGGWWYFSRPQLNPLQNYPTDGQVLVQRYFSLIASGRVPDLQKSLKLLSWPLRKQFKNEAGAYRRRVGFLDDYLIGLFGSDWGQNMQVLANETSTGATSVAHWQYVVRVGTETFHVRIVMQNQLRSPHLEGPACYGIVAIRELPWADGGEAPQAAGVSAILAAGGMGHSGELLQGISAAYNGGAKEESWQIKMRLLPIVENPRAGALRQCVYQLWPVRHDPTVRGELTKITTDARYAPDIQQDARQVLANRVPQAILVGNGVVNTQ